MPLKKGMPDWMFKYLKEPPFEWNVMTTNEKQNWYRAERRRLEEKGLVKVNIEDFVCPHCRVVYTTKWNRDRHVKRQICRMNTVIVPTEPEEAKKPIHLKPKPKEKKECCVCNICKLTFISKEYFDKHTEKYHQSNLTHLVNL